MSEEKNAGLNRVRRILHTGRAGQVLIYLGKQLRFFINENDWKVLPMAAIIAGLVSMVIRKRYFVTMEGSLIGAFALTCVAIWNGCFNSIQAVCRERAIIKREHRSGMHITAYVAAHMIYQFLLCAMQTGLTLFVIRQLGVPIPKEGFITNWMLVDIGITMLLISYAADMMSLFLSSISRTTTGAMTLMPFILIFQLIFSGGIIPLPAWSQSLSNFTISNYGIRALAAQSDYNNQPMTAVWTTISGMKDSEIGGTVSLGQILDGLDSPALEKYRDTEVIRSFTAEEISEMLGLAEETPALPADDTQPGEAASPAEDAAPVEEAPPAEDTTPAEGTPPTEGAAPPEDTQPGEDAALPEDTQRTPPVTVGMIADFLRSSEVLQQERDKTITLKMTVGDVLDLLGEENVKNYVQTKTAEAAYKGIYERSENNIFGNWAVLGLFILLFALMSTIALELIDKDKR